MYIRFLYVEMMGLILTTSCASALRLMLGAMRFAARCVVLDACKAIIESVAVALQKYRKSKFAIWEKGLKMIRFCVTICAV